MCLNTTHWAALYGLAEKSGTDFLFGISYDMVQACVAKANYTWDATAAVAMIKHIRKEKQAMWGFELGNEVNNRAKSCGMEAGHQAAAFKALATELAVLYPDDATRPKLLGPDVGYLDSENWLGEFLGNFSQLHAVTYHVYSWLNKKNYAYAMPIDNSQFDTKWYPDMVARLAPGAEVRHFPSQFSPF